MLPAPRTILLTCLVLATALPTELYAHEWHGEGAIRLREWLGGQRVSRDGELMYSVEQGLRLLQRPYVDSAVDSALTLLVSELGAFEAEVSKPRFAELVSLLGQTYEQRFEYHLQARPLLLRAKALYDEPKLRDDPEWYEIATSLCDTYYWTFESGPLIEVASEAHQRSLERGEEIWQAHFAKWLGRAYQQQGDASAAVPYYEEVLTLGQAAGAQEYQYEAYQSLGHIAAQRGDSDAALWHYTSAMDYAEANTAEYGYGLLWRGRALAALNRLVEADADLTAARVLLDEKGSRDQRVHIRMELASLANLQGEHRRSVSLVADAMQATEGIVTPYHEMSQHGILTRAYEGLGDYENAYRQFQSFHEVRARLDSIEDAGQIDALTQKLSTEREEALLLAQASWMRERRRYRWVLAALGILAVAGVAWGLRQRA